MHKLFPWLTQHVFVCHLILLHLIHQSKDTHTCQHSLTHTDTHILTRALTHTHTHTHTHTQTKACQNMCMSLILKGISMSIHVVNKLPCAEHPSTIKV